MGYNFVSDGVEYFNGKEWVKMSDYKEGDLVLQAHLDGIATLVKPTGYVKEPAKPRSFVNWHYCIRSYEGLVPTINEHGEMSKEHLSSLIPEANMYAMLEENMFYPKSTVMVSEDCTSITSNLLAKICYERAVNGTDLPKEVLSFSLDNRRDLLKAMGIDVEVLRKYQAEVCEIQTFFANSYDDFLTIASLITLSYPCVDVYIEEEQAEDFCGKIAFIISAMETNGNKESVYLEFESFVDPKEACCLMVPSGLLVVRCDGEISIVCDGKVE